MALKGDLASVDLAQVFQMLALNKKVGLLSIQSPRLWKVLYFDSRGVTLHHNPFRVVDRVVEAFVRNGTLQEKAVDEAREHAAAQQGGALVDSLLAGGYVTQEDLDAQYRQALEEEIYDLFFCKDARFEFFEGSDQMEGRDGIVDERFFFNTDSVIMEAARRIDEWAYISEKVSDAGEVFRAMKAQRNAEPLDPEAQAVLDLVDGRRNVARIIELSGVANFQVFKQLCQLLDSGRIVSVPAKDLVDAGAECMREGRTQDAINLFEKACASGVATPDVHAKAAAAYRTATQFEFAAIHLKAEAELRVKQRDYAAAAANLFAAVEMLPTDLAAREKLVDIALGHPNVRVDGFDALAEGKSLVDLHLETGDIQRVRSLLERLLKVQPNDLDLKKVLVNVHTRAGDQKRVIELYESIANDLVRTQRPIEAIGYLQKILMLDRSRADVSERVRHLYEADERSRSRKRNLAMLGMGFMILTALAVGYFFYDQHAGEAFARIDVRKLLEQDEYDLATEEYESFIREHPLTRAVMDAKSQLTHIESLRKKYEATLANQQALRERELGKLRSEYKAAWAKHREQFLDGHPEAALESLERVRKVLLQAGEPQDMAWALEEQVEKTLGKMREYLGTATTLANRYDERLAMGDWKGAREAAVQLLKDHDITQVSKRIRVPVLFSSRPNGGRILQHGKPLVREVGGKTEELRTPAVVLVGWKAAESFSIELKGFEPQTFTVDARNQPQVDVSLKVVGDRRITFSSPVQTGVGAAVNEQWFVVALRGGSFGVAKLVNTDARQTISLGGLKAIDSTPVLVDDRVWFATNEATIECFDLRAGAVVKGWPVRVPSGAATDITVRDGRIVAIDRENSVSCWNQSNGALLWRVPLDGTPSGPATMERRIVRVATGDGRIVMIDASDGRRLATLRSPAPITTSALAETGVVYFGTADGNVRAVDENDGRILWTSALGRVAAHGEIALSPSAVLVLAKDNRVVALDRVTGKERGALKLLGALQKGMQVANGRVYLQLRIAKTKEKAAFDVLQAASLDDLTVQWEYADQGQFAGPPGIADGAVALPSAAGEVVLFR